MDEADDRTPQKKQKAKHVLASIRMLEHIDFPWKVLPIIRHHHERYDGSGYPEGLAGDAIPLASRIVALCEAWDTMTSSRSYKLPRSFDDDSL